MKCISHPGQEAVIRCLRCQSPLCKDCLRDIADRFLCANCVAELVSSALAIEGSTVESPRPAADNMEAVASDSSSAEAPPVELPAIKPPPLDLPISPADFVDTCDREFARHMS